MLGEEAGAAVAVRVAVGGGEAPGVRAGVGEGRLRRLLHHLAELTGEQELALAGHRDDFDEQQVAAGGGPGEAGGDADPVAASSSSEWWRGGPRYSATVSASIVTVCGSAPAGRRATCTATLRQIDAISRSRLRRPASRV